ncbi:MAG: hypothetical protein GX075_08700 [Firmicutes bacterium]|nr:hypothetical protein [Bacillota bacterium]
MTIKIHVQQNLVWYAVYGSNLLERRFLCYIRGGTFNGITYHGCHDKSLPKSIRQYSMTYPVYFSKKAPKWDSGGVAFIRNIPMNEKLTLGKAYLITHEQFKEVQNQEGLKWYGKEIYLGELDGYPVLTITSPTEEALNPPSFPYLKVIYDGLRETYQSKSVTEIIHYLYNLAGVKDYYSIEDLNKLESFNPVPMM